MRRSFLRDLDKQASVPGALQPYAGGVRAGGVDRLASAGLCETAQRRDRWLPQVWPASYVTGTHFQQ
jgi:hypothetical protein